MTLSRGRKTKDPCPECRMHRERCICAHIPKLHLNTRLALVVHARELKRTTNTGRLAVRALVNSEMRVRGEGRVHARLDLSDLLRADYESFLLYPGEDAQPISILRGHPRVQLIVPDGNWRQASKVATRHPELAAIPRVRLDAVNTGTVHLRAEHFAQGFSTLEAIARALGVIEGPEVQAALLALYQAKLEATLRARGLWRNL